VRTAAGAWWAVFLGTRPYEADLFNTGRETFLLPVTWRDGWPVILTGEATVPYTHQRPSLPVQDSTRIPTSGSFTYRDEFSDTLLGPEWQFLRTPRETWHDLRSVPGSLTIRARPVPLSGRMQPSFLARRQQHLRAGVSTAMRYTPQADGDQAGLVAFQNDQYYFFLGVALVDGRRMIVLERHAGDSLPPGRAVIASAEWPLEEGTTVYLHIDARGRQYDFAWGLRPEERRVLRAGVDGSILSTSAAGGFVGAMFGLFAYASTR
jgi:alpha-N-arabinofuranosidase